MNIKLWDLAPVDKDQAVALANACRIPPLLAALLQVRGCGNQAQAAGFLEAGDFSDPFLMKDMDRAVDRIRRALRDFERIAIYGDYDADGVTATAMLYTYLQSKDARASYYIPQRDSEGYGMNMAAVDTLSREGAELIITVDNGVSANEEIAYAQSLGMDVVVTDHHQPHEFLPDCPVIDAHRADDESPFKDFSGAGVVLKLLMALEGDRQAVLEHYADLAALGTVGDSVPLTGENRLLVLEGLERIARRKRPGLDAILDLDGQAPTSTELAFSAIPCVNATGRMGAPERAVRLLTYEDTLSALALASEIKGDNLERKRVEANLTQQACLRLEAEPDLLGQRIIVVDGPGWHHGVVGIVASRLTERYGKPCVVLSTSGGTARGSGRSVEGFDLFQAVNHCRDLLERYGGHPMAAGVTLKAEDIGEFRRRLNEYALLHCPDMPALTLKLDCTLKPSAIGPGTLKALEPLEPFGVGNAQPLFALCGVELKGIRPIGSTRAHCRLTCERDGFRFEGVRFGMSPEDFPYPVGSIIDLAVNLQENNFRRAGDVEILVRDVRLSGLDQGACLKSLRSYEKYARGEALTPEEARGLEPDRDQLAALYRLLPREPRPAVGAELLLMKLLPQGFRLGQLLFGLDLLSERGLVFRRLQGSLLTAYRLPAKGKTDLQASPLLAALHSLAQTSTV